MPSTLDPGYAYNGSLIFAADFEDGSGNAYELVTQTAIGALNTNAVWSSDADLGGTVYSNGTGAGNDGVNFGDFDFGAPSAFSLVLVQKLDDGENLVGGEFVRKAGGGDDEFILDWLGNEGVNANVYNGATAYGATTYFLKNGSDINPQAKHAVGFSWDGTNITVYATDGTTTISDTQPASFANLNDTVHAFILHYVARGHLGFAYAFNSALPQSEFESLTNTPTAPIGDPTFSIDTSPSAFVRAGSDSFVVSNPAVAPTTGNTTITIGGQNLTVDSVTGAGPYTINFTVPSALALQHGSYQATITIGAESNQSGAIPFNPPAGFLYVNLNNPDTSEGKGLYLYDAKALVTGDQWVYEETLDPSGATITIAADGTITPSATQTSSQTFDAYAIASDGTIYATEVITWVIPEIAIDSISATQLQEGVQYTLTVSNSQGGATLSIPAGALTIDSQTTTEIVFTVPADIGAHGDASTLYLSDVALTVSENGNTDFVLVQFQPGEGEYYGVIAEVAGIYSNDTGVQVGHAANGYFEFGGGDVDLTTGTITVTENSVFRYRLHDGTAWGAYQPATLSFVDTTPDQHDLGGPVSGVEPNSYITGSFVVTGIDPGEVITYNASNMQASTDGLNYGASVNRQLNQTVYWRIQASANFNDPKTGTLSCNGISDSITVTTRAATAPTITTQPQSQTVEQGGSVTFNIAGNNIASYQWIDVNAGESGEDITGATSSSYTINNVSLGYNGFDIQCRVTSPEGVSVLSSIATLTVQANAVPVITGTATHSVNEGVALSASYTITNRDGQAPTLSGPDAAQFTLSNNGGDNYVLTLPARDYENPQDADTDNVYQVTINIDDGVNSAVSLAVTVTVQDVSESFWSFTPPASRIVSFS